VSSPTHFHPVSVFLLKGSFAATSSTPSIDDGKMALCKDKEKSLILADFNALATHDSRAYADIGRTLSVSAIGLSASPVMMIEPAPASQAFLAFLLAPTV
jgi:hypothetical protein